MSYAGLGPEKYCASEDHLQFKRQIRPLVREAAPHQQTRNCLKIIQIWSWTPDGGLTPRQTGRLTVGRNITLNLTLVSRERELLAIANQRFVVGCGWKVPADCGVRVEAEEFPLLEAVTKQHLVKDITNCED
jgi:hypothetical protein